jgi:hypothetical protein
MNLKPVKLSKLCSKNSVNKININLSPNAGLNKRRIQFRRFEGFKLDKIKQKSLMNLSASKLTYSIAYIGDNNGTLSMKSKKFMIPRLSHKQMVGENKSRYVPPCFSNISPKHSIHKYFRPKALTPGSFKIYDFSEYKFKMHTKSIPKPKDSPLFFGY